MGGREGHRFAFLGGVRTVVGIVEGVVEGQVEVGLDLLLVWEHLLQLKGVRILNLLINTFLALLRQLTDFF